MTKSPTPRRPWGWLLLLALVAFIAGYVLRGGDPGPTSPEVVPASSQPTSTPTAAGPTQYYTCSMHPTVRLTDPNAKCPICFMALIPVPREADHDHDAGAAAAVLRVSPSAQALMEVQTQPVLRRRARRSVALVGKVDYDETRLAYIAARFAGRIDRLYVDYTGTPVRVGDHLAELYSPDLLVAQEELLQARGALSDALRDSNAMLQRNSQSLLQAARDKLRLLGLTSEQINTIEERGQVADHVTISAPAGGIVIEKSAKEGSYVQTGDRIYTIADLSRVWVMLDAYETDLPWLRFGQTVQFTTTAHPGQTFTGTIAFINPVLDDARRIATVRVNVDNADGQLKPGMLVRAEVVAEVAGGGQVIAPHLAGKWISPMHPEIVKDHPGTCDICGMALVRAEDLGYTTLNAAGDMTKLPLVAPASAVLLTGPRAIVYVRTGSGGKVTFEGRQVTLGPRVDGGYLVLAGLREGELVVTQGNFKIDSALQIQAKASMMNEDAWPTTQPATTQPATTQPATSQPAGGSDHAGH